jgi:energy-coupling factor transporter ATP-binding protein EcfA2
MPSYHEHVRELKARVEYDRPTGSGAHVGKRPMFKTLADFCAEYVPIDYAVDGVIRTGSLYTLTGPTGSGKTAFNVIAALAIETGREGILGRPVTKGRTAYCVAENPDDVRMKYMIAAFLLNIDFDAIADRILISDQRRSPEDIAAELRLLGQMEPFVYVCVDTFAAFYDGKQINDPIEAGNFARRWRPLTAIPGKPAVVISSHPVKGASESQLIPYGSGAILNEVDGNLTLWRTNGGSSLHWQGKLRGLEFEALQFRFELTSSPDVVDKQGREIQLPTMRPTTAEAVEDRQATERNLDRALLAAMLDAPSGTQAEWGLAISRTKARVSMRLRRLKTEKLVEDLAGKSTVTAKGKRAVDPKKGGETKR